MVNFHLMSQTLCEPSIVVVDDKQAKCILNIG